jgi:hypothetical protein
MSIRYFKDPSGSVHGFDASIPTDVVLMNEIAAGWTEITGSWPPPPAAPTLAQAQASAQAQLLANMNQFTATKPDGSVRYDQNFINSSLIYALSKGITAAPLPALLSWQTAVKTYYLTQQAAINAATTIAEVDAVDVSLTGFEAKYGTAGTVTPDPNITTAELA